MFSNMFYQEAKINKILKCQKCSSALDEARLLPCGNTICSSCTIEIEYIQENANFRCLLCSKEHSIPSEGFPINLALSSLMNEKPDEIYRSEQVEKLKSNLSSLKANLNQLDLDLTTGVEKITEHCCELRRLVQLSTEEKILEINRFNETFIERINQYEKETKEKYLNKKVDPTRVNELNEVVKSFIEKTNEYLNDFKIDDKQVNIAFCEAELHKKSICDEIKYRKTILFDDNLMTFEVINLNRRLFKNRKNLILDFKI